MYISNSKRLEIADISTDIDLYMQQFHPIEYTNYYIDCGNKKRNKYSFKSDVSNALIEQKSQGKPTGPDALSEHKVHPAQMQPPLNKVVVCSI